MKSLLALLALALVWLAGLFAFADRVSRLTPPFPTPQADGIVVLTGASEARLSEGMHLLQENRGRRLLVSGVNRVVSRAELRKATDAPQRLYECCVDLGFDARNTLGNAQEIAAWSRAKGFSSIIVVTSDYHMPRSLLEIRGALPGVRLYPYPVATPSLDSHRWWRSARGARFMTLEYCKYLVVLAREGVLRLGALAERDRDGSEGERAGIRHDATGGSRGASLP